MYRLAGAAALWWSGNLAVELHCVQSSVLTQFRDRMEMMHAQVQTAELVTTNQVLGRTHTALAHAMLDQGRAHDAAAHSREAVMCVRSAYGVCSEVAKQEEQKWRSLGIPSEQF